ncbi:MAG: N-acetylmuramoyl-L-alanine amidase [Parafilimonas terrae]|nr:N-acetylmuramoyl-L-alanine amidase [Parafilimonas terrae]
MEFRPDSALVTAVRASPNHGPRAGAAGPTAIVLHYTGMTDGPAAIRWLRDPASQVSCHYVVEENGAVLQLLAEERRAWHAGRSSWHGETDLNSLSIGIEIVNGGHDFGLPPYPDVQIAAVAALCRDIMDRRGIPPARVLAHSDVAPGRKRDPGERFPWIALHARGVVLWVPERGDFGSSLRDGDAGPEVLALQRDLAEAGYGVDVNGRFDDITRIVVEAFQRRHRPSTIDGVADAGTRATLRDLLDILRREGAPGPSLRHEPGDARPPRTIGRSTPSPDAVGRERSCG